MKTCKDQKSVQYGGSARAKSDRRGIGVWAGILTALFAILLIITLVLTQNTFLFYTICSVIGGSERYLVSGDPDDYTYYSADYGSKAEVLAAANKLNEQICEEGFVLLKNENEALPLGGNERITVFGKNSVDLVYGGSGSNAGSSSTKVIDLYKSLTDAGFKVNPVLKEYYESTQSGAKRPDVPTMGSIITGFPICEGALPYPDSVKKSYHDYADAALVVISRIGGEGYDLPRSMFWDGHSYTNWNGDQSIPGAKSSSAHYLELDQNETDMISEACSNFSKVILIINSASPLELGFLTDETDPGYQKNLCAAIQMGAPGSTGVAALGRLLAGSVTPSGRLADTYPKDFEKDPTWYNFGNGLTENGNQYLSDGRAREAYFVEYREGIYFGYRYYETRAAESLSTDSGWYEENVVFPFGYGLSYTEFSHTVTTDNQAELSQDSVLNFEVEVTNTGNYAGKEVVQLYYTPPYTAGGIEKPHVVLAAFAKTELLQPGATQKLTLTVKARDMASYDYSDANKNGFKGYELEAGEYCVYVADNAHGWTDPYASYTYTMSEGGYQYETDSATGTEIGNLFDDVSGHISEYLSRKNNFENYSVLEGAFDESHRTVDGAFISSLTYTLNDKAEDPWYSASAPKQSERVLSYRETDIKIYDLIGKSYDDALWDQLLNQLTVSQMTELVSTGNFRTLQVENIDKPLTTDADGPMGFALFMGERAVYDTCYYASETVLASTWNTALARAMGRMVGNEGLIGDESGDGRPYSGWYAPAMNLHRSQFGGRNFEYYSEDSFLSGAMAQNVILGAEGKGLYTFMKHFALNEQETKRDATGLITWANEQAMREIYFKPFEMCVKEGNTHAVMSSFNRIGVTWTGGSYPLLTQLLRGEWGFEGMVITDFNLKNYMNTDQMLRAGGDLNLSAGKSPTSVTTPTDITQLRRATKNVLFTVANSCAMNGHGEGVTWGYTTVWWVICLIVADCVVFAASAVLWGLFIRKSKKCKEIL